MVACRLALILLVALGPSATAHALNKQGARAESEQKPPLVNLSGFLFAGGFLFNPTYAARPNNSGLAAMRYGLHVDLDLYRRYITLSYDLNMFTDGSSDSPSVLLPSEHDHILGLLSNIPLPRELTLTLAVHYEHDAPGLQPPGDFYQRHPDLDPDYSQSYVDLYARLGWEHGRVSLAAVLGGFLYNPTYAARPDNSGLALLRYVLHGEVQALPWLTLRQDFNFFTDKDEFPLLASELDWTSEVALHWRSFELRYIGEADLGLGSYPANGPNPSGGTPGLRQFYLAALLQWSFDVQAMRAARK